MILEFPQAYPDELLYSVVARFGKRFGFPNLKSLPELLFGTATVTSTVEFPSRLRYLQSHLPAAHPFSTADIIGRHSLFSWYAPFLPVGRRERLRQAMLGDGGCSASALVGLQAARVRVPRMLRFCPLCFKDDESSGRELYWRRLHQVTGVEVCPRHRVFLEDSDVRRLDRQTRHSYEVPTRELGQTTPRLAGIADEPIVRVASLGERLLAGRWPSPDSLHKNLLRLLGSAGYGTLAGRVKTGKLISNMARFYPSEYLGRINGTTRMDWVARLVRHPRSVQPPIRYLLLLAFLDLGLEPLLNPPALVIEDPCGPACENALCTASAPMTYVKTELSPDVGGQVEVFQCEACGRVVARCSVGHTRTWVREHGPVWQDKLRTLWADGEQSLRSIAKTLGVDPMTVKRQAMKLGLKFPRSAVRATTTRGVEAMLRKKPDPIPRLRRRWLVALQKGGELGIKAMRKQNPALYASLYRRDRAWLMEHRPARLRRGSQLVRVDWTRRDRELSPILGAVSLHLRCKNGGGQVTPTALFREAGKGAWLPKLAKFPKCRAKLARIVEDREAFACRRVKRLAFNCQREGRQLDFWELQQQAGLRPELLDNPQIQRVVDEALDSMSGKAN